MKAATVTVVRIERNQLGPWAGSEFGSQINNMLKRRFDSKQHAVHCRPTIWRGSFEEDDRLNELRFVYGCQSYEDLVAYFGIKIIRSLLKRGFEVKTYTVDWHDVRFGKGELVVKGSAIYGDENLDNPFRKCNGYKADRIIFNELSTDSYTQIAGLTTT